MSSLKSRRRILQLEEKLEKLMNAVAPPKLQLFNDEFKAAIEGAQKRWAEVGPKSSAVMKTEEPNP